MPMKGIQLIMEVLNRDSTNMYAQFMLGLGGMESGQFGKAIDRLSKVVNSDPDNVEAVLSLAEAYERTGDKQNAVKWYSHSRQFFRDKKILDEIDQRIRQLKQS
jgi:cytochrome c-type biogenesis protein CcmH/NrfG